MNDNDFILKMYFLFSPKIVTYFNKKCNKTFLYVNI